MNTRRFKSYLGWTAAIIGYYIWFQSFYNAVRYGSVWPYDNITQTLTGIAYNFPPILLVFLCNLLIVFRIVRIQNLRMKILSDVVLSLVLSIGVNLLYLGVWSNFHTPVVDWAGSILNDIIILMVLEVVCYFTWLSRTRQEIEDARHQALQYRYDAIKSQINPHFLFNSLNLLYSLVSIDTAKSKEFIHELARMYRYIMAQQNRERITVEEELDFLGSYISVLAMRYNNKFSVTFEGEQQPDRYLIPFTMQLLIENVTKHNVISSRCPMTVGIRFEQAGIVISNPIHLRETESVSHIGLRYLTQLYASHGKRFYTEDDGNTFHAHIPYL